MNQVTKWYTQSRSALSCISGQLLLPATSRPALAETIRPGVSASQATLGSMAAGPEHDEQLDAARQARRAAPIRKHRWS